MQQADRAGGPRDVRTARLLVAAQFALLGLIVALPTRADWPVPGSLAVGCVVVGGAGAVVMGVAATALGRGLTAVPLPNRHAQLRTGGLYSWVRHPIYSGLLLTSGAVVVASGSSLRLVPFLVLVALLTRKARWEESRLARAFPGYPDYAARTPRFVPSRRRR